VRTLREGRIHRVMALDDDRLCGVISTFDLLALLEKGPA
jgi:CBS domain-containing protein